jgi:hypothetical protein
MHTNPMDASRAQLTFDLRICGNTILFENISLEDNYLRLQNVLDIHVNAKSLHSSFKKTIGQVRTSLWVFNKYSNIDTWNWDLDSNDISAIEGIRTGDISFEVEVKAIVEMFEKENKMVAPIIGIGQIRFSESDWLSLVSSFGYSTKYGNYLSTALLNDKCWLQAYELLDDAREHMQRGKTYDALRQCLSTIESYMDSDKRGGPYSKNVWEELLHDITPQKKDGISGLLAGVSTYLNKVGHHRNSKLKDNGNLTYIPLDQYEAELMLSISQLIVTYLERLRNDIIN